MQSDGNSFCVDVVSNSFNKTSRDENHFRPNIYKYKNYINIYFYIYKYIKASKYVLLLR